MCLNAHNIKPLVCHKDLVVYKMLSKRDGKIVTPYMYKEVELGKLLKAEEELPSLPSDYSDNEIQEGVIHAAFNHAEINKYRGTADFCAKAIIKAGTPFFVDVNMKEIAAKEMFITSETSKCENVADNPKLRETLETLRNLLFSQDNMKSNGGVRVGDVMLPDRTFAKFEDIPSLAGQSIIGVVGFIRPDGSPQVISLYNFNEVFSTDLEKVYNSLEKPCKIVEEAANDFDGYGHTKRLAENKKIDLRKYPGIYACYNYAVGPKKGEWYLPAVGEMLQLYRNFYFVNEAIEKINSCNGKLGADKIKTNNVYMTSTPCNFYRVCGVDAYTAKTFWIKIMKNCPVRPFLHLP